MASKELEFYYGNIINFLCIFLGKLTLKIPWKNLYSEAVVATLDGLYLLVVPEASEFLSPLEHKLCDEWYCLGVQRSDAIYMY